jgi:NAD(P)-dependent dehydrogenase (short-subunit alcohol dehydrogenase family)
MQVSPSTFITALRLSITCRLQAGITDESHEFPIWKTPLELWTKTYDTNIRGTFLTIKHFLQAAEDSQRESGKEVENLAIVVTGSETGKFGQAGKLFDYN